MIKFIIDCIQYERPFMYAFYYILIIFIAVTIWLLVNNLWWSIYRPKMQERLFKNLQFKIYKKAVDIDLKCYDDPEYYNDFIWALNESNKRVDEVLETVDNLFKSIATLVMCGIFMLSYDIMGIIFVAVAFIGTYFINKKINKLQFNYELILRPIKRERDYINRVFYLKDYAKEIRLSNIKEKLYKDYDKVNNEMVNIIKRYTNKIFLLNFISNFFLNSFIFDGLYIIYLLYRTIVSYALSYGTMVTLYQSSVQLKNAVKSFTSALPRFQQNSLYIERLKVFLSYEPQIIDGHEKITKEQSSIILKDVSFSYNKNSTPILKNINMIIRPKEKIAIVGHNGAGKTTLVNLLLRLYDVSDGSILYDGINIDNYKVADYRGKFSTVLQDYQIFASTIAHNVVQDSNYDEDKIVNSLKISGFYEKFKQLNKGINTVLTKEFDNEGVELSGGESQKLAIARTIYKDSEIIILDEPSSALDPISEYYLNQMILEYFKDKTVIFISHRLSTTRMADRIYLFENGIITEQGNHNELMKLNGNYAKMFSLQAKRYTH
jgi:ABC-type multidrug transport system, ATPase and permease components